MKVLPKIGEQQLQESIKQQFPVSREDLVFAIPTHKATEAQLKAGRSNRMVLIFLFALNPGMLANPDNF